MARVAMRQSADKWPNLLPMSRANWALKAWECRHVAEHDTVVPGTVLHCAAHTAGRHGVLVATARAEPWRPGVTDSCHNLPRHRYKTTTRPNQCTTLARTNGSRSALFAGSWEVVVGRAEMMTLERTSVQYRRPIPNFKRKRGIFEHSPTDSGRNSYEQR